MIYALVTLYNPKDDVIININNISKQVDKVFICDNSINSNVELFKNINNLDYIFFNKNLGLSGAFNAILKNVNNSFRDDDFIIFFDQDSNVNENHVKKLINEFTQLNIDGYDVGCIGPVYFNQSSSKVEVPKNYKVINENNLSVKSIITSSMLTRYSILKEINFWNEDIFLDLADWDFCWRILQNKKLCVMTKSTVLNHTLGIGEKKIGLFKLRIGNTFREYYQIRDSLKLLHKKYTPIKFKIRFILMLTIRYWLYLIFLDDKKNRVYYHRKGITDYHKKINGAL